MTAAHCLYGSRAQEARFILGINEDSHVHSIGLVDFALHPGYQPIGEVAAFEDGKDLAVARLAQPVNDIAPVNLYLQDASDLQGETMRLVGYGAEGVEGATGRTYGTDMRCSAAVRIASVSGEGIHFDFSAQNMGSCRGDSGGSGFVKLGDSYAQVGVTSYGDLNCTSSGTYQRPALQSLFYDPTSGYCVLYDAQGTQCGGAPAYYEFDPYTGLCTFYAGNLHCGQQWAYCDDYDCYC